MGLGRKRRGRDSFAAPLLTCPAALPPPGFGWVLIRHDGSGLFSAWHLAMVEVTNGATGKKFLFPCGKWLDASSGDRKTERWLQARARRLLPPGFRV